MVRELLINVASFEDFRWLGLSSSLDPMTELADTIVSPVSLQSLGSSFGDNLDISRTARNRMY